VNGPIVSLGFAARNLFLFFVSKEKRIVGFVFEVCEASDYKQSFLLFVFLGCLNFVSFFLANRVNGAFSFLCFENHGVWMVVT